jgi:hypothetical protein
MALPARVLIILMSIWQASAYAQSVSTDRSMHEPLAGPGYTSAFQGYRRFSDQPVTPWRESNDLVGRIGGWQAYARESQAAAASTTPKGGQPVAKPAATAPPELRAPPEHD